MELAMAVPMRRTEAAEKRSLDQTKGVVIP